MTDAVCASALGSTVDEDGATSEMHQRYEIVLVTYRSRALAESMLSRIPADFPVALIDNGQGVDGVQELAKERSNTRYLHGPAEGFAVSANLGAATSSAEFVVFVNPDSAPTMAQLDQLVADLQADPALVAVGATTVLPNGQVELGVGGWEPNFLRSVVHTFGLHAFWPTLGLFARPVPGLPLSVDWLSGACLAVVRKDFLALGGFDEQYFVYNEDMAFGRRAREAGRTLKLRTDILVPHASAGSGEAKPWMFQMRGASMAQYLKERHGAIATLSMKITLSFATILRAIFAGVRRERAMVSSHLSYLRGLWVGAPDLH